MQKQPEHAPGQESAHRSSRDSAARRPDERVAFIGLGNMGGPMAIKLASRGFDVRAFDLSADAMKTVSAAGVHTAASAAEAVHGASVVISMLPAGRHVADLYLGSNGLFARLPQGTLVIDSSTIDVETAIRVANDAVERGLCMIDAPVSGGTAGASAGTLTFIVGAEKADLERARTLLQAMGKNIFHAGGRGAGQMAKICNNMLLGIQMTGTAEALALGVAHGLDPAVLSEIMSRSSARNWVLDTYNPWPGIMASSPASRGYQGGFGTDLMLKDLELAANAAQAAGLELPLGTLATACYRDLRDDGKGKLDFSAIVQRYAPNA